jgi:hypothetical protein
MDTFIRFFIGELLLTELVKNHEKTTSSHVATTPFSIHPAFIFFLQPLRAALPACQRG